MTSSYGNHLVWLAVVLPTAWAAGPAGPDLRIDHCQLDASGRIEVGWSALPEGAAYTVEVRESLATGNWQPAAGVWPIHTTSWRAPGPLEPGPRFYRVRAESLLLPPTPTDTRVVPADGTLVFQWAPAPLATAYLVYWSVQPEWNPATAHTHTVVAAEFVVREPLPGVEHFFAVQAVGERGVSAISEPIGALAFPRAPAFAPMTLGSGAAFLYSGPNSIQKGVAPGTLDPLRIAVMRSGVRTRGGAPLAGVTVRVLRRPEFGHTESRSDGSFDLAVNGGEALTLEYRKPGYLPVHRHVRPRWQQFSRPPEVVLTPVDANVTSVRLGNTPALQVAQGSQVMDRDGRRQAALLIAPGTAAELVLADGTRRAVEHLNLRATEYTVGGDGPRAMPAELPPEVAYTYCVEFSADEALDVDAAEVRFDRPLYFHVDNFLGFPVGGVVPVGYYDRWAARWVPAPNGRIIAVLAVQDGRAELDLDGSGRPAAAAALAALGISDAERQQLASRYPPGRSLWRVGITHFTPWDLNWPAAPPDDATPPDLPEPDESEDPDDPCDPPRPIVEYQTQVLGERLALTGVPQTLNYRSDRVPGSFAGERAVIPLSGSRLPDSLKRIELEIVLAGNLQTATFPPEPNQTYTLFWDGRDLYGRSVVGATSAGVRVGYVYDNIYWTPAADEDASFGNFGEGALAGNPSRAEITLWQEWEVKLGRGRWDARIQGLGGWTLSDHHVYDAAGRVLYRGDGSRQTAGSALLPQVVRTVAGGGDLQDDEMEGRLATDARLDWPWDIAVGPDGSIYLVDGYRVRHVRPDGTIHTLAGNGSLIYSGDGGPAIQAGLNPQGLALGPRGDLYVTDLSDTDPPSRQVPQQGRIRRISPDGIITTVAGPGRYPQLGDGGPAREAFLWYPTYLVATPDGGLYVADTRNDRIRRIAPDGNIRTVAGGAPLPVGQVGDGNSARDARLDRPYGIALGPDGSLYIADSGQYRIRRVAPSGIISTYAGTGERSPRGDQGPAIQAGVVGLSGLAVSWDGSLLFIDQDLSGVGPYYVRRIGTDGIITRAVGGGEPDDGVGEGLRATQVGLWRPYSLTVGPEGALYVCDSGNARIRRLDPLLPGIASAEFFVVSTDGREAFVFAPSGRHLRTLHTLTGAVLRRFEYDAEGRPIAVVDGDGNVTRIERTADGTARAIIGPFGQRTALDLDPQGYLARVTHPSGDAISLGYGTDGLLTRLTDERGRAFVYAYHPDGRLAAYLDPDGGGEALTRTVAGKSRFVTTRTALGRATVYGDEQQSDGTRRRSRRDPCGAETHLEATPEQALQLTQPDGTRLLFTVQPNPRFGLRAPLTRRLTVRTPGGLVSQTEVQQEVELEDPTDPFSLVQLIETRKSNERGTTLRYDGSSRLLERESPAGRTMTQTLDAAGRTIELQLDPNALDPITFTYNTRGLLTRIEAGDWAPHFEYDALGRRTEVRDATGRPFRFTHDANDRLTRRTLPSGRVYQFRHDATGQLTEMTLPDGKVLRAAYSAAGDLIRYETSTNSVYRWTYDLDHALATATYPDGQKVHYTYDTCGRLDRMESPAAVIECQYAPGGLGCCDEQGQIALLTRLPTGPDPSPQALQFSYDGTLVNSVRFSGFAAGAFGYAYDGNQFLTNISWNGGTSVRLDRDQDGLVVRYGPFELTREGPMGAVSAIQDGRFELGIEHDGLGRSVARRYALDGEAFYACEWHYEPGGFVTEQSEAWGEETRRTEYTVEADGLLTGVTEDGEAVEAYTYDLNANRLADAEGAATYDPRDCLTRRGNRLYEFDINGRLARRGDDTFEYGLHGELLRATVNGQTIQYVYDGLGRRVGRVAPEGATRYLYGNPSQLFQVTVFLDAAGTATRCFHDEDGLLFALERGAARFYVATDGLGTPKTVLAADGTAVRTLRHDTFGRVLADSNPGFLLPVGFAGGLPDPVTGLVRFGWRDYEPDSGRWTTPDPLRHESPDPNPYLYANGNPVSFRDPAGLFCVSGSAFAGIGGGGSVCYSGGGVAVCFEMGIGVGASLGLSTGGLPASGTSVGAEVSASMGLLGASLSGSINECGKASVDANGSFGPSQDAKQFGKIGVSAKVTVTRCWRVR
ncbi:MAG: hypothetical protein HS113_06005 [Verrucomicrobiales bacterium]|nr:hypothetical protein [Verrucomicrobiales bacterium]